MPNRKQKKQKCTVYINMRVVPGSHMITFITLLFINDGLFLYEKNLKELSCAYVIVIDKYFLYYLLMLEKLYSSAIRYLLKAKYNLLYIVPPACPNCQLILTCTGSN